MAGQADFVGDDGDELHAGNISINPDLVADLAGVIFNGVFFYGRDSEVHGDRRGERQNIGGPQVFNRKNITEWSFILLSVAIGLLIAISGGGKVINYKLYDILFTLKPKIAEWNKILYVDVDDTTIDKLGVWPIPRYIFAEGITALKELGADKIILDIDYFNPAPRMLNQGIYNDIKDDTHSYPLQDILTNLVIEQDKVFAKALAADPVNTYLSCRGVNGTAKERIIQDPDREAQIIDNYFIPLKDLKLTNLLVDDPFMESPVFPLYLGAKGIGSTYAPKDDDGSLRSISLFTIYKDYLVPQLSPCRP